MPRLPKKVPVSKYDAKEQMISAALVFACQSCFETEWHFTAYNHNGRIWQVKRCNFWACFDQSGQGKWMTMEKTFEMRGE